jgi:hypothetical protein
LAACLSGFVRRPAIYEWMQAGRPALWLTGPDSETRRPMTALGYRQVAPLESVDAVEAALELFLAELRSASAYIAPPGRVERFSRRNATGRLAGLLDEVVDR